MQYVSLSTSTNFGIKPFFKIAETVVPKVKTGVITSEPSLIFRTSKAMNNADDPELTKTAPLNLLHKS